ncbi:MAG: sulfite exporter TauE/SafE family protein [Candidatus Paceibacterota bacterium]|jgi:sulfite exporter TauE/SafE/copper chaperone CopZ
MTKELKRQVYYIKGMHCASCELVIEKKVLEFPSVEFADASLPRGEVVFDYRNNRPSAKELTDFFSTSGYVFSEQSPAQSRSNKTGQQSDQEIESSAWLPALTIIIVFILLERFGLSSFVNITASAAWPVFLVFGIIAGLSSCAALVGGLLLSLSKQWQEQDSKRLARRANWEPSLMFNLGRLLSYVLLGLALGLVGQKLQLSPAFNSALLVIISILMTVLALQMFGVKSLQRFKIALPKSLTRKIASGPNRQERTMPFVFGFLTFLLPCGFTLMVESLAILSGNPWRGAIMLGAFALGTAIPLMAIGWSSAKLLQNETRADRFLRIAGILVLFFVFYNLNVQFNFINWSKWSSLAVTGTVPTSADGFANSTTPPTSANEQNISNQSGPAQVVKTVYTLANDIQPNTFTVKRGQPISFQVDVRDNGQGCMSTIMIRDLYNQAIYLQAGKTIVMNFTPTQTGDYQITCAMGVPRGIIHVI